MKRKRILAWLLTLVMILSGMMTSPVLSVDTQAASKKYVKSLSVKKSVSVAVGEKVTVKPTVKVVQKASTKVKVTVKNKKIAKASYSSKTKKITIQGKKIGKTTVTVATVAKNKNGKTVKKTINVNVVKKTDEAVTPTPNPAPSPTPNPEPTPNPAPEKIAVSSISLSQTSITLLKGEKAGLTATVLPESATDKTVKWSSSPADIVTLTANGLNVDIQAVKAGTATITATAADGSNKTASCTIEVKDIVTVTSQAELDKALAADVGKIILDAEEGESYTISGSHGDTELVVNGTGAAVENTGTFSSITVSGGTYTENANGNTLLITTSASVAIAETASVNEITVNIPEGSKENAGDKVVISNDGSLDTLNISSGGIVEVKGSADEVIATNISAEDVKLTTNQTMNLSLTAKAELVFRTAGQDEEGGAAQTTIQADTTENTPDIYGVGQYEVTYTDGSPAQQIMAEVSSDIDPLEDLYGTVVDGFATAGEDGDAGYEVSTTPLAGVKVYLVPAKEYENVTIDEENSTVTSEAASSDIVSATTDEDGKYSFGETPSGNYYMVMLKSGYKKAIQFLAVSSDYKASWDNETMELLDSTNAEGIQGSITGTVKDAATGNGIQGLTVELRQNKGITVGDTVLTSTTGEGGTYTLETTGGIAADQYTIRVVDNRENAENKYIAKAANVCVKSNNGTVARNIITSASIGGEGIRFVLSWGTEESGAPDDLDSHLFGPRLTGSGMFEVYYNEKTYGLGDEIYAQLDVDDTSYEGPETITINKPVDGVYYYYVHNYAHDDYGDSLFSASDAKVDVYAGDQLLTTYNVPAEETSTADWWKVCSYNTATKKLTSYNTLESNNPYPNAKRGYEEYIADVTSTGEGYINNVYIYDSDINIAGTVPWETIKNTLRYIPLSGYEAVFTEDISEESSLVGTVAVSKNGESVKTYSVYYGNVAACVESVTCTTEKDLLSYSVSGSTLYINGTKDWDAIKGTLSYKVGEGYTTAYEESDDSSYVAKLNVLYGDVVEKTYDISYSKQLGIYLDNSGELGVVRMDYSALKFESGDGYIAFYTPTNLTDDEKENVFDNITFSDSSYTGVYDAESDTFTISNGTNSYDCVIYYYSGYFITDVNYPSLYFWYEGNDYLDIYCSASSRPEEDPVITCVGGYTASINDSDEVEIKDTDGNLIVKKKLWIESYY